MSHVFKSALTGVFAILSTFTCTTVLAIILLARIHHATIVSAIAGIANALVGTWQIFAFTVSTIEFDTWALTFVYVNGAIGTGVPGALAVARKAIHSVVTFAVVLARHITLRIRRAIVDVGLAVHAGVTESAGAFWRLIQKVTSSAVLALFANTVRRVAGRTVVTRHAITGKVVVRLRVRYIHASSAVLAWFVLASD